MTQALALGLGSMFNHSTRDQNVGWKRNTETEVIVYTALRDIKAGEELCISYGSVRLWFEDVDANAEADEIGVDENDTGGETLAELELRAPELRLKTALVVAYCTTVKGAHRPTLQKIRPRATSYAPPAISRRPQPTKGPIGDSLQANLREGFLAETMNDTYPSSPITTANWRDEAENHMGMILSLRPS
ncbi:hypothetical protein AYL99_09030 [Fonsecaea erecta]|uniref:SET domain-containing protein n=1 Tax=Fonsecaea erecta TaxID=1367422 RepID=A0A178ZAW7_9EURO|nr:hypothetical protein AYL99_09030 [Fonsecaea erecta]OAP56918.1 hypothetical protein AYL99_09030 [Fonsecaea erecta]